MTFNQKFPELNTNQIKQLERLLLGVIGENEPEFNTPKPYLPVMVSNRLKEQQRKALKVLLYGGDK